MKIKRPTRGQLMRLCGTGNKVACEAITLRIFGAAQAVFSQVDTKEDEHPNKMPFKGVLLILDQASTKPPHGSNGHRIYVSSKVAKGRLSTLVGMGINYDSTDLDSHQPTHKVGVITKAWIEGNKVMVEGIIYKKDFPKAVSDLKQGRLGMSMELANVWVRDANESVWHLEDFYFTGATILKKEAAAYYSTALAASKAAAGNGGTGGRTQMKHTKKKSVAAAGDGTSQTEMLAAAIERSITHALRPVAASMDSFAHELSDVKGLLTINAAAAKRHDDDDADAARHDDDDADAGHDDDADAGHDDDDADAQGDDEEEEDGEGDGGPSPSDEDQQDGKKMKAARRHDDDDDEDMDAELEDLEKKAADQEPGEVNDDASNKGDKKTVTKPPKQGDSQFNNSIAKSRLSSAGRPFPKVHSSAAISAAAEEIRTLHAAQRKQRRVIQAQSAQIQKLSKKVRVMSAQVERYAEQESRRSVVPTDVRNILAKANVNVEELRASGTKLMPEQMDEIFAASGVPLEPAQRIAIKNKMSVLGLLDEGRVDRQYQM